MTPPRIGVLIRSTGRPSLAQALASVAEQQVDGVEVLVVAAGTQTLPPLHGQAGRHRLRVLESQGRGWPRAQAANRALDHARGELLLFLDDDDWLLPGHLARLEAALCAHPLAPAAYAGVRCQQGRGPAAPVLHVYDEDVDPADMQLLNRLPIHAVMFRRACVEQAPALRFADELEQFEDWDFWLQLMTRGGPFVRVPGVSAVYCLDAAQGSGHAEQDSHRRRINLERFGQRRLHDWGPAVVATLVEAQARQEVGARQLAQEREQAQVQWQAALAANEGLVQDLRQVDAQRLALAAELSEARAEAVRQQDARRLLQASLDDLQQEHARTVADLQAHRQEVDKLSTVRLDHLAQIESLHGRIASIYASTSWRVTRPLRLAARALAFLRAGGAGATARRSLQAAGAEWRRRGLRGVLGRLPHYLRHAGRYARVLAVRPAAQAHNPFEAEPGTLQGRLHADLLDEVLPIPMRVSVVIPTLDGGEELDWLVRKLLAQQGLAGVEVVIVDSGSSDGSAQRATGLGARVVPIAKADFSHSHARNLGADAARGDYLVFMVQDAFPVGDRWLWSMLRWLLDHADQGVVAVSCNEYPRSDSELVYDCAIATHYQFLGSARGDRIGRHAGDDHMALRSMGQISDVACMIGRDTFMRHRYRGDYAEDLDLGIRLIQAGHKVAMLASVKVIHSHTRPAWYHLKRSFVDVIFLVGLFDDFHVPAQPSLLGLVEGACRAAARVAAGCSELRSLADGERLDPVLERLCAQLRRRPAAEQPATDAAESAPGDPRVAAFLDQLLARVEPLRARTAAAARDQAAADFSDAVAARIDHLRQFLAGLYELADDRVRQELVAAVEKSFAAAVGAGLAFMFLSRRGAQADPVERELLQQIYEPLKTGV